DNRALAHSRRDVGVGTNLDALQRRARGDRVVNKELEHASLHLLGESNPVPLILSSNLIPSTPVPTPRYALAFWSFPRRWPRLTLATQAARGLQRHKRWK